MSSKAPIALILGSGPNIGQHVAQAFSAKGYKIVLASRSPKSVDKVSDQVHITSDLSDPSSVAKVFEQVKALGNPPSVVVYNAAAFTPTDPTDPLTLDVAAFRRDLNINTNSAYAAAHEAVAGFADLLDSTSRTFIYTGNILNTKVLAPFLTLGVGKTATAYIIELAANAYKDRGYKFYYADEREDDGTPMYKDLHGDAHAELFVQLAEGKEQGPWQQTFVKGQGYKDFSKA
ncbi:hypothetical protein C1H76_6742 [Elsinoe australis]|uniref:Short-chain dehydrogenase n=1 Tax=Elsinoe australis TaxID=40998 RepID=A0A4U7AWP6_9PEZI|nr:hypothetical protein C1H76_6742 [Elsinoe australis]